MVSLCVNAGVSMCLCMCGCICAQGLHGEAGVREKPLATAAWRSQQARRDWRQHDPFTDHRRVKNKQKKRCGKERKWTFTKRVKVWKVSFMVVLWLPATGFDNCGSSPRQ